MTITLFDVATFLGFLVILQLVVSVLFYIVQTVRVLINKIFQPNLVGKYGKWAVVTGCTDGIGLEYTRALARRGLNVVLISRTKDKLQTVAADLESKFHVETKIIAVDFSEGRPIFEKIASEIKGIEIGILVNNVGTVVSYPMTVEEMSEQLIWEHLNINIAAATMMISMILPNMKVRGRGAIVNLSSVAGIAPIPYMSVYSATKSYIEQLTRCLRYECRNSGVTVQSLTPGFVNTRMVGYSSKLRTGSELIVPTAETYVRHAILTLGVSGSTSGYFGHELKAWFAGVAPGWLWINIMGAMYTKFRSDYHKYEAPLKTQ